MYKRLSKILVSLAITNILLAACQAATPTEIDCTSAEVLCVGLVTGIEGLNDKSYNQSTWEGLLNAQTEKVADRVYYIETVDTKDYNMNITALADNGYDMIVTVGDSLGEVTSLAAKSYPTVLFIGVDQHQAEILPNLVGLVFHDDQAGFLAGALAAQMTRSNTIAAVLGADTPKATVAFKEGFEAGARYLSPEINIISTDYPGEAKMAFTDPHWGVNTAAQAIKNGADIIFGASGMAAKGSLIETASHDGVYCIGIDTDQWETIPEAHPCLITSVIKLITPGVVNLIQLARSGGFPSGNYYGAYGLASYHDFDKVIPQEVKDNISLIAAGLKDGSITTGYIPGK